jgi:ABC-type lipoprotein export system ATPase subunit
MEKIIFQDVVPEVFAQRTDLKSDVWNQKFALERGKLYLVEAESGKGKSTFCSYILGYRHDHSGNVLFDDKDTRSFSVKDWVKIRREKISCLFQELKLFPELSAMENIEIKNKLTGFKSRKEILEWFDVLGIPDKVNSKLGLMSFGQQQRVAMMRALCQPFDFILADEPISHLDDNNSRIMGEIMMEEAKRQGAGVIVTSIGKHMPLDYQHTLKL